MIPHSKNRHTWRAFTLTELLVVISIIAILASFMMPALIKAQSAAKSISCINNLRNMGTASQMYVDSYNGYLPAPWNSEVWPVCLWSYKLRAFMHQSQKTGTTAENQKLVYDGVFRCPAKENWNPTGPSDQNRVSYGLNRFDPFSTYGRRNIKLLAAMQFATVSKPNSLSRMMLIGECNDGNTGIINSSFLYNSSSVYIPALWHNNMDNILFCDTHVRSVMRYGLAYDLVLK